MAEGDVFNKSSRTIRTPPLEASKEPDLEVENKRRAESVSAKTYGKSKYVTNSMEIPCNRCEHADEKLKLRCCKCGRWWHMMCEGGLPADPKVVHSGKWRCTMCNKVKTVSDKGSTNNESFNVTRVPLTSVKKQTKPDMESTRRDAPNQSESKSAKSVPISTQPKIKTSASGTIAPQVVTAPVKVVPSLSTTAVVDQVGPNQVSAPTDDIAIAQVAEPSSRHNQNLIHNHKTKSGSHQQSNSSNARTSVNSELRKKILLRQLELKQEKLRVEAEQKLYESRLATELKVALFTSELEYLEMQQEMEEEASINSSRETPRLGPPVTPEESAQLVNSWIQESVGQRSERNEVEASEHRSATRDDKTVLTNVQHRSRRPANPKTSRAINFLNPNVTMTEFLEDTLRPGDDEEFNITKNQARARKVILRDLPEFNGDPTDWPNFMSRFVESTKRCGYTEVENLDRLAKCLKGRALTAVKGELHNKNALPSVLKTLRMRFGRPEVVYEALIKNITDTPDIKFECLDSLLDFSMSVKTLCDALQTAELENYLYNPILLRSLIKKLPSQYRIMWGNFAAEQERKIHPTNVDTFNLWLQEQAEIYSATHPEEVSRQSTDRSRTNLKPKKREHFQGAHVTTASKWKGYCHACREVGHMTVRCPKTERMSTAERWQVVKKARLCMKCFGKYFLRDCGVDLECTIAGCGMPHHPMLHDSKSLNLNVLPTGDDHESAEDEPLEQRPTHSRLVLSHIKGTNIKFQIVPVILSNGSDTEVHTFAFLDNGSEVTLLDEKLAKRLKLHGHTEKLRLKWSNEATRVETESMCTQLTIADVNRTSTYIIKNVRTVKSLCLPTQSMERDKLNQYMHLKSIPVHDYYDAKPEILIGVDNYQLMIAQETVEGKWNEPVAVKTRIGWTVYGKSEDADLHAEGSLNVHQITNAELKELVDEYFSLENIGIEPPKKQVESQADSIARELMEKSVRQTKKGPYITKLLWKDPNVVLPDSYAMAVARMKQFERKIDKLGLREQVNKIIQEYHHKRYLVELTAAEKLITSPRTWHLPIFTVTNPNKPSKIRMVWDAAATVQGVSLNDHLYTGPDLLANLAAVLYKFRERKVAVGGDIESMFHQIVVEREDQDSQRCVWRETPHDSIHVSRMRVMTFGAACSPVLAQYVKNKNALGYKDDHPRAVEAIINRHYVDDYLDSFDSPEEAKEIMAQVLQIHQDGGFKLRGLISNNNEAIDNLQPHQEGGDRKLLANEGVHDVKVLGMWWETSDDKLRYKVDQERIGDKLVSLEEIPTKRQVLRALMMVFDPLGLLGHIILKGKLVLKAIWRRQTDWDEAIHPEEFHKWSIWLTELQDITTITIPRWYFSSNESDYFELHVFVDAGEEAAAAIAYIVRVCKNDREVALIGSKTKVGPNKPTSIPRMELQAAVIGTRLSSSIQNQHSIEFKKQTYWTDSRNVLCWLRSPKRFKVYVAHRIGEIRETTYVRDWRYVPTKENPADLGTKWIHTRYPMPEIWFRGPAFLGQDETKWPEEPSNLPDIEEGILEVRANVHAFTAEREMCPEIERFSSLTRLVRTQAQVLRFFYWGKSECIASKPNKLGPLQSDELKEAELYLIREVQKEIYREERNTLQTGGTVKKTSPIKTYSPFLDQHGILRMKSRLIDAEYLSFDQRCPIILPRKHHLTELIIRQYHEKYLHQNHATVLNEIRQRFMIAALRASLKSLRSKCWLCRKRAINPENPEMSPLPRSRLAAHIRPFSYTGVDYFGPLLIKHGRRIEKRWGAIFTCLTTRAVHLELSSSLSSDSFILVLRCFIARRGMPNEVYCDNGTNFHGAENELRKVSIMNSKSAMESKYANIKWHFNPPYAPHMGGAWERLVRSVKTAMSCLSTERVPTEELLRAILADCEMLINSRPLTYIDSDGENLEALTPNHFLLGSSSGVKPFGNMSDDPEVLKYEWKRQQLITATFWKRFIAEYLPAISRRSKWHDPIEPLKPGDIVALANIGLPGSWQLGRVRAIVTSKDGGVRQAEVKTANGVYTRPASKLAVLMRSQLRAEDVSSVGGGVAKIPK